MRANHWRVFSHTILFIQSFIVGLSFYFLKVALEHCGNDAYDVASYRFSAAFLGVLVLWAVGVGRPTGIRGRDWLSIVGVSVVYPVLFFLLQTLGVAETTATLSGMLYSITPVVTLVGAALFIRERASILQVVGILISVGGLSYMLLGGGLGGDHGESSVLGVVFILLSVVALASYMIIVRRLSQRVDAMKLTCAMLVVAAVIFNAISLIRHGAEGTLGAFVTPPGQMPFLWSSLYLGLLSSLLASWVTNFALIHLPAAQVSVYNNLIPVGAALGGYYILHEVLHAHQLLGTLVVIGGVSLVLFAPGPRPKSQPHEA